MNNAIVSNPTKKSKPKRVSKTAQILAHLQSGKPLTQWECTYLYRSIRLAGVVHQLRGRGYKIRTMNCKSEDGGVYAKYKMEAQ